jgi:hypothetical protein
MAVFSALEQRIDADLAAGEHAQLVGELGALAAQHPLRERLHGQLMLALYRSGARPMRSRPTWPWVQALRGYLREGRQQVVEAQLTAADGDRLVALLPELAELVPRTRGAGARHRRRALSPLRGELLLPYDDHVAISCPEVSIGAVALRLGVLGAMIGRPDDARRHFADALALHARIGAGRWQERTERRRPACSTPARSGGRFVGVEGVDGLVARRPDREDLIQAGDLERLGDVRVRVDDGQDPVARAQALDRADEDAERGGVQEGRLGEVDDDPDPAGLERLAESRLQLRRGEEVDLACDGHDLARVVDRIAREGELGWHRPR